MLTVLIIAASAATIWSLWVHKKKYRPPKKWHKMGELTEIMCFPIKSCGVIKLQDAECTTLGLRKGKLRDRAFVIVNEVGDIITAKKYPRLIQIIPVLEVDGILITAAGSDTTIHINIQKLQNEANLRARIWEQEVKAVDCGDDAAKFLSRIILDGCDKGLRLLFYPEKVTYHSHRSRKNTISKFLQTDEEISHEAIPVVLVTETSVESLNMQLPYPASVQNLRANLVVRSCKSYEEETWEWIKIGSVLFHNVKPCSRCLFVTVNSKPGAKDVSTEAEKTVMWYKKINESSQRNLPVFGINLAVINSGTVSLNDPVYIAMS